MKPRPRYILEKSEILQYCMLKENLTCLRAQKLAQGVFLGVLAQCSNGNDEAQLSLLPTKGDQSHTFRWVCDGIAPMPQGL